MRACLRTRSQVKVLPRAKDGIVSATEISKIALYSITKYKITTYKSILI